MIQALDNELLLSQVAGKFSLLYDKKKLVPIPMVYCPEATLILALVIELLIFEIGMLPPMTRIKKRNYYCVL